MKRLLWGVGLGSTILQWGCQGREPLSMEASAFEERVARELVYVAAEGCFPWTEPSQVLASAILKGPGPLSMAVPRKARSRHLCAAAFDREGVMLGAQRLEWPSLPAKGRPEAVGVRPASVPPRPPPSALKVFATEPQGR